MKSADESRFTPGPWQVSARIPGVSTDEITSPYDACWIARVQIHTNCTTTPSSDGNACLIAAGPEMHRDLKQAVEYLEQLYPLETGGPIREFIARCRYTLAKAESRHE